MMRSRYFALGISALIIIVIIFICGCVEKQIGLAKEPSNGSKTEIQDFSEESKTSVELPEENKTEANITPEDHNETTPATKLLSWQKEAGIRISGVSSSTIFRDNQYWMYYTGNGIELARSSDGLDFVYVKKVIDAKEVGDVDMVSNPAIFKTSDGKYRMVFEGSKMSIDKNDRKLYSAISSDGLAWKVEDGVRFEDVGDGKPGELMTSVPDIIRLSDGRLRMYYTRGITSATALSSDEGLTWTKETNLELRKVAIDPDIVLLDDGVSYKLFFTTFEDGFGMGEQWIMGSSSVDGVNFVVDEGKLIEPSTSGGLVTDPDVIKIDNGYRMYYGEFKKGEQGLYESEPNIMSAFILG